LHASVQPHQTQPVSGPTVQYLATPAGRLYLASCNELDEATIERILVLREEASEDALAANPALLPSLPAFHQLVRRAIERPALAKILLQRTDLTLAHEASLYLPAGSERRAVIRERIARDLALAASSSVRASGQDVKRLSAAAAQGDIAHFERLLSARLGFPNSMEWRILQIGRHVLLALALKALGLESKEAARIFLTLHPALSYPLSAIRDLMNEMRNVPQPVALALVESILGRKALCG